MSCVSSVLSRIRTVADMTTAFSDESHCRQLFESMVWPRGRLCPRCGYRHSTALPDRDEGGRSRPGLYQCANRACCFQFTATTHTPLHSTKLPIKVWLTGLWLMLQSDKGISSIRLAEAVGVSQPTAWRMGHILRLLVARDQPLDGTIEMDDLFLGGAPRKDPGKPRPGVGRKGHPRTEKSPAVVLVQRPENIAEGTMAGEARAKIVSNLSESEATLVLEEHVDDNAHLMTDEWKSFKAAGQAFVAHDAVRHSIREYARGIVHVNSAEGFNDRVRRVVAGVFHHISPQHADLYFNEIGFRWAQRIIRGQAIRHTRKGRAVLKPIWERIAPAMQLPAALKAAVGRQLSRTKNGGIQIKCAVAVFGL